MKKSALPSILLLLPALGSSCSLPHRWNLQPYGRMNEVSLQESSGVVASRRHPGVLWTHNDDAPALLFAVNSRGRLIRIYHLVGVSCQDWEDIALDEAGNLYLLDNTSRQDPQHRSIIYFFREPDPYREDRIGEIGRLEVAFPDQGHDCETLMVWGGDLYLVTKPWDGSYPRLYRHSLKAGNGTAFYVGQIPIPAMVTGGDISADGRRVALSSYRAVFIYQGPSFREEMLLEQPLACPLNAGLVEGIAWQGDRLVLTNEERQIFLISRSQWSRHRAPFLAGPEVRVPFLSIPPSVHTPLSEWSAGTWLRLFLNRRPIRPARAAWSREGLHLGIDLSLGLPLAPLETGFGRDYSDWFRQGRLYLLINPDGARPLAYSSRDCSILLGRGEGGALQGVALSLKPATLITAAEERPSWLTLEEAPERLLVTIAANALSQGPRLQEGQRIGFNLLWMAEQGKALSWTPLTRRFTWDSPSVWGVLELAR